MVIINMEHLDSFTNKRYLLVVINVRYLDDKCQHEIPGWLLPMLDIRMSNVNMRYLDGDTYMRYLDSNMKTELP